MHCTRKVTDNIYWVGGNDRRLALFENLFPIPRGVSYNSYLIMDEKTALMDTVDFSISRQFIENVQYVLDGRTLDYLVINHMEPDHCANIEVLVRLYPEMKLVGNAKTVQMIKQFYEMDLEGKVIEVKEKEELSLGVHTLQFFMAPMVHWPEVMVAYEQSEKVLFSADGFGTFGALNGNIFNDEMNFDRDWLEDARRYYTNIVGKYGVQVQALLKKAATLDIAMICPLHGPVWRSDLGYFIDKYDKWSRYEPEDNSVMIVYGSMYGNTENAANVLAMSMADAGVKNIAVYDASVTHVSHLIAEAFRCSHIVVATPTYNGGIYPSMESFLLDMKALGLRNRKVGLLDNGTWAPTASKQVKKILEEMKEIEILGEVSIKSTLKPAGLANVEELKDAIITSLNA
ncbi:MAG: FprA family A-type flavoprotein [Clostridiales bacterium]|nr:FprA family A-type flavoprotein [Clostridiales bacterium]MDU3238947.1 FprA family A-type flavoprotein [Clostridiales bacterium]